MINITAEQFEQLLPFVGAATEYVFTKALPSMENVYFDLVATVIGSDFEDAAWLKAALYWAMSAHTSS